MMRERRREYPGVNGSMKKRGQVTRRKQILSGKGSEVLQIRIERAFDADRGMFAVSGEDLEIIREGEEF